MGKNSKCVSLILNVHYLSRSENRVLLKVNEKKFEQNSNFSVKMGYKIVLEVLKLPLVLPKNEAEGLVVDVVMSSDAVELNSDLDVQAQLEGIWKESVKIPLSGSFGSTDINLK